MDPPSRHTGEKPVSIFVAIASPPLNAGRRRHDDVKTSDLFCKLLSRGTSAWQMSIWTLIHADALP